MIKFRTRSGAVYALDLVNKTWERQNGLDGCNLRSSSGEYYSLGRTGVRLGESVWLICPSLEKPEPPRVHRCGQPPRVVECCRVITTTPVVEIWA